MPDAPVDPAAETALRARRRWAARIFLFALPICAAFSALAPGIVERALLSESGRSSVVPSRPRGEARVVDAISPPPPAVELDHRPLEVPRRSGADGAPAVARLSDVLRSGDVIRSDEAPAARRARRQTSRPPQNPAKLRYAAPDRVMSAAPIEAEEPAIGEVELELGPSLQPPPKPERPVLVRAPPDWYFREEDSFVERYVAPSIVPEPASALLVASGLLLLATHTRRLRNG